MSELPNHKPSIQAQSNDKKSQIMDPRQRIEIVAEIPPTRIKKNMGGLNPKNSEKGITIFRRKHQRNSVDGTDGGESKQASNKSTQEKIRNASVAEPRSTQSP